MICSPTSAIRSPETRIQPARFIPGRQPQSAIIPERREIVQFDCAQSRAVSRRQTDYHVPQRKTASPGHRDRQGSLRHKRTGHDKHQNCASIADNFCVHARPVSFLLHIPSSLAPDRLTILRSQAAGRLCIEAIQSIIQKQLSAIGCESIQGEPP